MPRASAGAASTDPTLAGENERLLARIAWSYHVEGLTQGAVAERLGVTRLRVNRALADARRLGLVRVALSTRFAPCIEAETGLVERFGLTRALVAPTPLAVGAEDDAEVQDTVGAMLGHHFTERLADPSLRLLGMSWGGTLNAATRHVVPPSRPDLEIVSVMGGLTRGSELNTFEITTRLAGLCGASHSYFPAPIYAGSRASRDTIMGLDVFAEVLSKIRRADALALAAGDLSPRSLLMRDGLPADVTIAELVEAGGIGDVLGTVLAADGRPVDHPLNERRIGLALDDLAAIPDVILAAGGLHKVPIMRALLARGHVDTLVTDERTATALLGEAGAGPGR